MPGRRAKPIGVHLSTEGGKHLTKEEIKARLDAEVKLGADDLRELKPGDNIKGNAPAIKQWKALMREYIAAADNGHPILSSSDVGSLSLYCKLWAEYQALQRGDRYAEYEAGNLSLDDLLKLENAVNKKVDMLIKLQDRLYLNPAARVKGVPQPKKKEEPQSKFGRFGAGGA